MSMSMSIMVMCDASDVMLHDKRRADLFNATLNRK